MATNQDFNNLIDRIDTATNTLESNVQTLVDGSTDVAQAVVDAQQAANTATQEAGSAEQSAITATQKAGEAASSVQQVQGIVQNFEEANVIGEAPINGSEYVRKDGDWVLNTGGGNGGGGDVVSVNGVLPDEQGDVTLDIPDEQVNSDWNAVGGKAEILNKPELFSGDYNDLSNKPSIPTQGVLSIVAGSNITIDDTDPLNPVISGESGGGGEGYPLNLSMDFWYGDSTIPLANWPDSNPHNPIDLSRVGAYARGRYKEGMELLEETVTRNAFPVGTYYVKVADDPVGSTGGLMTVTWGAEINGTLMTKVFRFTPTPSTTAGDASPDYIAFHDNTVTGNLTWKPVGGEGGGGSEDVVLSVNNQTPDAQGNVTVTVPTKTSDLTNDSDFVASSAVPTKTSDLSNDSGFITVNDIPSGGGIEEAPNDGKQYARQNEGWTEVETGGGGSAAWPAPFTLPNELGTEINIDGNWVPWTQWQYANPFLPQSLQDLRRTTSPVVDSTIGYNAWFVNSSSLGHLPAGKYRFGATTFKDAVGGEALRGRSGVIYIEQINDSGVKRAWAIILTGSAGVGTYVLSTTGIWQPTGTIPA